MGEKVGRKAGKGGIPADGVGWAGTRNNMWRFLTVCQVRRWCDADECRDRAKNAAIPASGWLTQGQRTLNCCHVGTYVERISPEARNRGSTHCSLLFHRSCGGRTRIRPPLRAPRPAHSGHAHQYYRGHCCVECNRLHSDPWSGRSEQKNRPQQALSWLFMTGFSAHLMFRSGRPGSMQQRRPHMPVGSIPNGAPPHSAT